jgi:transcriptional regulator with XRE-family HTH domain
MDDGPSGLSDWGAYLRRMTGRPGWSVARLAREAGIHRATIFDWIRGGGESVTIASVRAVAAALGDDLENALRAVAGLESSRHTRDEEMDMIMSAPVDDDMKRKMITRALELREQDRQQRLQVLRWLMAAEQDSPDVTAPDLPAPDLAISDLTMPDDDNGASEGAAG